MIHGTPNLNDWLLGKLEPLKDSKRILVRDPLQLFNKAEGVIHNFAKENGFTVIVAATNLVFRDLYEQAVDDADVKKILALDRTPAKRRKVQSPNQAPPLFYPDLLADTPANGRIEVDLRQFLQETTNDPLWPPATNDRQYARLILDHLGGVIRAHQNLVATSRGQFTDHDFQTIVAYAALGIPESAFKSHDTLDYWKIGLQGHAVLRDLADLSPEATRLIKGELKKAPEPFCWFVDREPEQVIRAFYLSVILSQHFQQWSLLLANIDASLKPLSVIKTKVLKDAAPRLIALDRQQAQNDLEAVESSLTKENLQLLLVEQLKLTGVGVAVSAIEKEKYSPLFRSLALLVALDDLLLSKPDTAAHQKISNILFPEPGAVQKELVDTIPTQAWSDLKEAYRLATEIQALRQVLAKTLKSLSTVTQPQQLSLKFFLDAWNGQRLNRLEYFLAALSRLIEHGQLLPRPELELPSAFGSAVHGLRTRIRTIVDDVHRQLDQLNTRFQQLVALRYPDWAKNDQGTLADAPILTSQFIARCLKPNWDAQTEKAVLFIFDGMRYDIWDELLKPMLLDRLEVLADLPGSSILPSETQLTRKAISAGLFPESFDKSVSEDRLLKPALAKEFGYQGDVKVVAPEGSGTGETVRYRAGNLDVYIFELCDKELHHIKTKKLPDGREVPTRPLSYVYEQNIKNIIDTEVMTVVRSLAPGTKVFVTADHGFGPVARERLWFDSGQLNEDEDCAYLNCWLRVPSTAISGPQKVLDNIIVFTPEQLRLPKKETIQPKKGAPSYTKEYRAIAFPRVGYAFSRNHAQFNPDAYSHGGISIQELVIPMAVLRVRPKDEGLIALDQIEGPKEVLEGQEAVFQLRLRRTASGERRMGSGERRAENSDLRLETGDLFAGPQSPFAEVRVDVEIEIAAPSRPTEQTETSASSFILHPSAFPKRVCYVGTGGAQVPITICHKPEEATTDERRAGSMQRVLTVTVNWREGARTARKSRTLAYNVQLNSERVVRRLGNLGSILGLAPKGIR
jgi:hypothetical protein